MFFGSILFCVGKHVIWVIHLFIFKQNSYYQLFLQPRILRIRRIKRSISMLLCVGRGQHGCFMCLYLSKTLINNYFFNHEFYELDELRGA
jgi:hypothetical protein